MKALLTKHLLALTACVALMLAAARQEQVVLSIALANLLSYTWIYLIWDADRKWLVWFYLLFIFAVGPFTYFGYGQARAELARLDYNPLLVSLFQPLVSLCVPTISFAVRFWNQSPPFNAKRFLLSSALELFTGVPLLVVASTTFLG